MPDDRPGPLDRARANLARAWAELSDTTRRYISRQPRPDLPEDDLARARAEMEACVDAPGDEASARARAAGLGRLYAGLNATGRARFLAELAAGFDTDRAAVDAAMEAARRAGTDPAARRAAERALRAALEPRWRALLGRFTTLPDGVKFLVDLRAEMLRAVPDDPSIAPLADDLREMLARWFDIGLLELRRIDWRSPASLLEKLIAYESVHAIRSWDDLKNRLDSDRRCFAFFHPNMPDEPLIFVEVALDNGMSASVDRLLDESAPPVDPRAADTAIFYSISNAQRGLAGIGFGNFLIKRVVEALGREFPNLRTFATLSPIPGFARWLAGRMAEPDAALLTPAARKALRARGEGADDGALLSGLLAWADGFDGPAAAELEEPLKRLAALYLATEKGRGGRARDSVAHFHLANGARIERLNWMGDRSGRGLAQSHGLMVNYLYRLGDIEANSAAYARDGAAARSASVRALLRD